VATATYTAPGRNAPSAPSQLYGALDEAKLSRFHWLTVLTAGMGFFTDAYDLFIIGTVTAILSPLWHLSTLQLSWLNSTSLLASVLGAVVFGRLMDRFGRKRMYGVEVALLTVGALLCAVSTNVVELIVFRAILGFGVGGDYSTSAVITSEYANRANRGRLVGTVFAMQGFGLLAGPLVAAVLLGAGVPHAVAWRLMLAFGAIPAASVIYLRRKIKETPRYTLGVSGDVAATAATVKWALGTDTQPQTVAHVPTPRRGLLQAPYLRRLIGTAGTWALMDMAFYGNGISSQLILKALLPNASLLTTILIAGLIFLVAAVPGYWVAVALLDRLGRRRIQWQGFLVMALAYGLIFLAPGIVKLPLLFLVVYGISYFFIEFGPNETTFVYPSEIFPVHVRGLGDGLSAAGGKLGAFAAAFLMPLALQHFAIAGAMGILAGVSLLGLLLTLVALPEPKGLALEQAAGEAPVELKTAVRAVPYA
jgi:MFS transporter, PHS family, inorganic phosphate transporter